LEAICIQIDDLREGGLVTCPQRVEIDIVFTQNVIVSHGLDASWLAGVAA
jgi:hypothetical protein